MATVAASVRSETSSFSMMRFTWFRAVFSLIPKTRPSRLCLYPNQPTPTTPTLRAQLGRDTSPKPPARINHCSPFVPAPALPHRRWNGRRLVRPSVYLEVAHRSRPTRSAGLAEGTAAAISGDQTRSAFDRYGTRLGNRLNDPRGMRAVQRARKKVPPHRYS